MNDLNFNQSATLMNAVFQQATGKTSIVATDSTGFVSQATTVLLTGYNNTISALSQVLSRTIFSVRPYSRKLNGIKRDSKRWGNHIRKITILDKPIIDNDEYNLTEGQSLDPWIVKKPEVLQTNFYDANAWSDCITRFQNQLDTAFSSAEEFGAFVSACMQEISDKWEKYYEENDRLLIASAIASKTLADSSNVINLLTEYYNETGTYLVTDKNDTRYFRNKNNIDDFSKWVSGFMKTLSSKLTERTLKYHMNFTNKDIPRHTPKNKQHLYLYSPDINGVRTRVLSDVFNPEMLGIGDFEEVNYWQSFDKPDEIKIKPSYVNASGEVVNSTNTVSLTDVFGILFDDDFLGSNVFNTSTIPTPINARGKYFCIWYHATIQYFLDLTENCVVFLLKQTATDPSVMGVSPLSLSIAKGASKTATVVYPQGEVTVSATGIGISATYSAETGKVTVTVASDASAETGTVTVTDTVTTKTINVTVTGT